MFLSSGYHVFKEKIPKNLPCNTKVGGFEEY